MATFLGLNVPPALQLRILTAVRGLYPDLTAGKSDSAAIQLWVKLIVTEHLASWEARQAAPDPSVAAQIAADAADTSRRNAEDQARGDASTGIVPTVTT